MTKNPLDKLVKRSQGRLVRKWSHYFDVYHRHFARFRGRAVTVVEFGVSYGGSAQMWREYFGPRARIYGIDINPTCKQWENRWFRVFIGDQADRKFLGRIAEEVGPIDILIDDGGHKPHEQIATFEVLYPRVKPGGVYLVEDLHTNYMPNWGGGYGKPDTFIEYVKGLTDQLNAFWSDDPRLVVNDFTRSTRSIHYYDSIIVMEKGRVTKPRAVHGGVRDWTPREIYDVKLSAAAQLRAAGVAANERVRPAASKVRQKLGGGRLASFAQERVSAARTKMGK